MFPLLLLLFIAIPFIELALLFKLAGVIGGVETFAVIIATGIVGASLARWQGSRVLWRAREQMARQELPGDALLDGAMILVAGALLLTPGILTDAFGFTLLIPPTRRLYRAWLKRWFTHRFQVTTRLNYPFPGRGENGDDENIIDGQILDDSTTSHDQR